MREHGSALHKFLTRMLGNQWDAEEVVQDTFLKICSLTATQTVQAPRALLYHIAKNLALNRIRHDKIRRSAAIHLAHELPVTDHTPGLRLEHRSELRQVKSAIEALPPRCREVFIRHRFHGQDYARIAADLQISRSMVKKHLSRALRRCLTSVDRE